MKRYFVLMICALLVWSLIPIPDADAKLRPQTGLKYYQSRLGGIQIDSLTWSTNFDSVRVGTLESTSRDTTITALSYRVALMLESKPVPVVPSTESRKLGVKITSAVSLNESLS